MSDKPVILISTGAWHPPECYHALKTSLEARGYQVKIPRHPSMGEGTHGVTWVADKENLVRAATPDFDDGREVVMVTHSYGGVPGGAATEGQGVKERAERGEKGGFREIIFIVSFAIPVKGWDLLTTFGGKWPEWQNTGEIYTGNHLSTLGEQAKELLYNDCSAEEAQRIYDMLLPHSQDAFETGCNFIASDITIPKAFVICETDLVFPLALQETLVQSTPGIREVRMSAGHSPFVGKTEETAETLVRLVEGGHE